MSDLNGEAWAGWLITRPELTPTESRFKTVYFLLACQHFFKDACQEAGWREHTGKLAVIAWNYQAERIARDNIGVGAYITIAGRLQTFEVARKLEGSVGGQLTLPITAFEIVVEAFNVITRGRERENLSHGPERIGSQTPTGRNIRGEYEQDF